MADKVQTADLDSTIALLQGGLTSVDPNIAISTIESWQQQLQGTEIAETLGELKLAIDNGGGGSISAILTDLGSQTSLAAGTQSGEISSKLQQLGQRLSEAGGSIM